MSNNYFTSFPQNVAIELSYQLARCELEFDRPEHDQFFKVTLDGLEYLCNPVRNLVAVDANTSGDIVTKLFGITTSEQRWVIDGKLCLSGTPQIDKLCWELDKKNFMKFFSWTEMDNTVSFNCLCIEGNNECILAVFTRLCHEEWFEWCLKDGQFRSYVENELSAENLEVLTQAVREYLKYENRFFDIKDPVMSEDQVRWTIILRV